MTTNVDLNQILARQDYVKMTKSLRERCDAVEDAISDKMVELDLKGYRNSIVVNGMRIVCLVDAVYVRTQELEDDICPCAEYRAISTQVNNRQEYYDDHDHYKNYPCPNKYALRFLNNAVAIIEELGKIEQKKVEAIEQAIDATKNL